MLSLYVYFGFRLLTVAWSQTCGAEGLAHINATGTSTFIDPFLPPSGLQSIGNDSTTWTWTIATTTINNTVEQQIWLDTQPAVSLTGPGFGFLGCGAILHGLQKDAVNNGQTADTTYNSVLSSDCRDALLSISHDITQQIGAETASPTPSDAEGLTAFDLCKRLSLQAPGEEPGIPEQCKNFFESDAKIETFVLATPQKDTTCPGDPAQGNVSTPMIAWDGMSRSISAYDMLATSVTPLIFVMANNRSINNDIPIFDWAEEHLTCLHPTAFGSDSIPSSAAFQGLESLSLSLLYILAVAVVSSVAL